MTPERVIAHVGQCIFLDGQYLYHGIGCPHADTEDENGPVVPVGWTAQQQTPPIKEQQHGK